MPKSQSISVRLTDADYSYLMQIRQNNAVTQSEKLRELIQMARQASPEPTSFSKAFVTSSDAIAPYKARVLQHPTQRSPFLLALFDLMAESAAHIETSDPKKQDDLEQSLVPAVVDFFDRILTQPTRTGTNDSPSMAEEEAILSRRLRAYLQDK
jgi:hypothetical protein